jgi:geranylgeranylglycerol-phosphate geranylgeranyltransferase
MTTGTRALGTVRLTRPHACAAAAAAVLVTARLINRPLADEDTVLAMVVVFVITGAGNTLNDRFDADIDRVNAPTRPIPSGVVSRAAATAAAAALFASGVALSALLTWWCMVIATINSGLLILYAANSKRLGFWKNAIVGYLVGSVFLFAALDPDRVNLAIGVLAACAALATVAREIVKDLEDALGDRQHHAATLSLRVGERRALALAFACLVVAVLLALLPYVAGMAGIPYIVTIVAGSVLFGLAAIARTPWAAQRLIMAGSVVQLAAFFVARN